MKALDEFYRDYFAHFSGEQSVRGDGAEDSRILLIGEAPGRDEVKQGKPFVGMAGKQLTAFLAEAGLSRDEVYVTNAIKYRLFRINPKTGNAVNRPAKAEEIRQNRPYLHREIELISPEWIVTLGNVPLRAVSEGAEPISKLHGKATAVEILGKRYRLFPLFHPASVIYRRALQEQYEQDMKKLQTVLAGEEKNCVFGN